MILLRAWRDELMAAVISALWLISLGLMTGYLLLFICVGICFTCHFPHERYAS